MRLHPSIMTILTHMELPDTFPTKPTVSVNHTHTGSIAATPTAKYFRLVRRGCHF